MQERLQKLAARLPKEPEERPERQAAVAIIVRRSEVLLMRRIEREGDRWSGQVSLPGGHRDESDRDLLHTAIRETQEEVQVDLDQDARFLGCLPSMQARADGGRLPMWITPFLFEEQGSLQPSPGPEAASTFWLPLNQAHNGELDRPYAWTSPAGLSHKLPSWRLGEHTIWGMTHHMLSGLLGELFSCQA
jgi:8-oxo-dGTP pyrophosphatase MutT (NUDIX family)